MISKTIQFFMINLVIATTGFCCFDGPVDNDDFPKYPSVRIIDKHDHYWIPILYTHDPKCPKCKKDKEIGYESEVSPGEESD